tara:strand:- start:575 stop:736 length:162 start_codon:yes stop_codon:yes gene_type:complete
MEIGKTERVSIRIEPKLREELNERAMRENRSFSNLVHKLLKEATSRKQSQIAA